MRLLPWDVLCICTVVFVSSKNQSSYSQTIHCDIWDRNKISMDLSEMQLLKSTDKHYCLVMSRGKNNPPHSLTDALNCRMSQLLPEVSLALVTQYHCIKSNILNDSSLWVTHSRDVLGTRGWGTFFIWHTLSHCILIHPLVSRHEKNINSIWNVPKAEKF